MIGLKESSWIPVEI